MDCPHSTSSATSHYRTYLKSVYNSSPISPENKWPPTPSREYVTLSVVGKNQACRDEYVGHALQGNIKEAVRDRKYISIEEILEVDEKGRKPKLVLMEGAPGIGKSTLSWELCRKWEEFPCMKLYSLVVLLRLREEQVQRVTDVSQLFSSYESRNKETLVEEVSENQGNGVLFILDGFDELPKSLQNSGFLLNLIRGCALPESTVLVTSRPSATAELLTSCSPRLQKHIEILGFSQESVEAYASSVFSYEPAKLEKFRTYISASENPAINSLMYVPLNAAIIVQIYRNSPSKSFLPHTLTELYTQLCLTILNRYLKSHYPDLVRVEKFEDLPSDLYQQFFMLSELAFEGMRNKEIVFRTVPLGIVHFGFLDAVSALYGGGTVSYNFLHLTIQEFFAAYHISILGSSRLDVFRYHGKEKRWNVVWRFVAGLTKFAYFDKHPFDSFSVFKTVTFIQCLFEAQSTKSLKLSPSAVHVDISSYTCLDMYALGYCIANSPIGITWDVSAHEATLYQSFNCGLNTNAFCNGVIARLKLTGCRIDAAQLQSFPLHSAVELQLRSCQLTNADMLHLSEMVPHMPCLKRLNLHSNYDLANGAQDGFLNVLRVLSQSNLTSLDISFTGLCILLADLRFDYSTALKDLIDPALGKLTELSVGDRPYSYRESTLAKVLSSPSSLVVLTLHCSDLSEHVSYLESNTSLTRLTIKTQWKQQQQQVEDVTKILMNNKTLQHLEIVCDMDEYSAMNIADAMFKNNTLQTIKVKIPCFRQQLRSKIFLDSRITVI